MDKDKRSKKRWTYSKEVANEALTMLQEGGVTYRMVEKQFNIPRSTLCQFKKQGKVTEDNVKIPRKPLKLNKEEEVACIDWISEQYKQRLPVRRNDLTDYVEEILNSHPGPSKNRPGRRWFELFIKRHPEIKVEKGFKIAPSITRDWLTDFEAYLQENKALEILNNPGNRIWNLIEMNFRFTPFLKSFLGVAKTRTLVAGSDEINVSIFLSISSAGQLGPVFIIYPYNKPPTNKKFTKKFPPEFKMKFSDYGEMTPALLLEYLEQLKEFASTQILLWPIVLLVDWIPGLFSSEPRSILDENDMLYFGVDDESPDCSQGVYFSLKTYWKMQCLKLKKEEPDLQVEDFAPAVKKLLNGLSTSAIISGCQHCKSFPFHKFTQETRKHYKAPATRHVEASTSSQSPAAPTQWRLAQFLILPDGTPKLIANSLPMPTVGVLPPQLPQVLPHNSTDMPVEASETVWLSTDVDIKEEPLDSAEDLQMCLPKRARLGASESGGNVKEEPFDIPETVLSELVLIKTEPDEFLEDQEYVISSDIPDSKDVPESSSKFSEEKSGSVKFVDIQDIFNQKCSLPHESGLWNCVRDQL